MTSTGRSRAAQRCIPSEGKSLDSLDSVQLLLVSPRPQTRNSFHPAIATSVGRTSWRNTLVQLALLLASVNFSPEKEDRMIMCPQISSLVFPLTTLLTALSTRRGFQQGPVACKFGFLVPLVIIGQFKECKISLHSQSSSTSPCPRCSPTSPGGSD